MGLGFRFLKHIERTKVLIHVVDVSGSEGRDPIADYDKIMSELEQYDPAILKKPMIVAANKMDIVTDEDKLNEFISYVEEKGQRVFCISAASNQGIKELLDATLYEINNYSAPLEEDIDYFDFDSEEVDPDYRKLSAYYDEDSQVFVLEGKQLTKIFNSTNFEDMGSQRYLYNYIVKQGGIRKLEELGLEEGDIIRMNDFEFEYFED